MNLLSGNKIFSIKSWVSPTVYCSAVFLAIRFFDWPTRYYNRPTYAANYWLWLYAKVCNYLGLIEALVFFAFIAVFISALIGAVRSKEKNILYRFRFVAINCMAAILAWFAPEIFVYTNYHQCFSRRMEVVNTIVEGRSQDWPLASSSPVSLVLPEKFRDLSDNGQIMVQGFDPYGCVKGQPIVASNIVVFFPIYRRGNMEYCPGKKPLLVGLIWHYWNFGNGWYWIESIPYGL